MGNFTEFEQEMLDRSRRIETRLTKIGIAQGALPLNCLRHIFKEI